MNHHDPRRIAHHFPPFDEAQARLVDAQNRAEWQETMQAQRRCVLLVILFWGCIAALVYVSHLNHWI